MKKNRSLEANIQAAKEAIHQMMNQWREWKAAQNIENRTKAIAAYTAAFTSCKVYIENYLKQIYPNEEAVPHQINQDIQKIVRELDIIEKMSEKKLQRAIQEVEQLSRHAA